MIIIYHCFIGEADLRVLLGCWFSWIPCSSWRIKNLSIVTVYSLQFTIRWYTYIEGLGGLLGDVTKKGSL